ncbi:MAG: TIGR03032 family protein [Desulforhopalus sp.]|nr:TIGR03032 family protein [Desulforhopalus sp.]
MKNVPANQPPESTPPTTEAPAVEYSLSAGMAARLAQLNLSLAFTSYQSNLLYMLGVLPGGGAHLHQSAIIKPMGLARNGRGGLVLAAGFQIIELSNVLQPHELVNQSFDACYMPRTIHITGELDAHDVGVEADGRIVFVNTRYNCLATLSAKHSFKMVWKPAFISSLVGEDRCHLNGLAMEGGSAAYVTAVSRSDTIDGWRDRRGDGGVVIDVRSNRIICEGLSMPHSPRLHGGELWIVNAGTGELGVVQPSAGGTGMGRFEPRVFCPGFLRGLAFHDNFAFVGLSKPRYKRFEGLDLDRRLKAADSEPWCGVQVIDLQKRCCVDWLRIDGAVGELFDVAVIPGCRCPMAVSPSSPDAAALVTHDAEDDLLVSVAGNPE